MIVLDTHAWLWWVNSVPDALPAPLLDKLESAGTRVGVASISCLEVALLARKGRIELPCALNRWFALALGESQIELLPLTPEIATASTVLPDIHKDPADRIIIATAQSHSATLATADETIRRYPNLDVTWQS